MLDLLKRTFNIFVQKHWLNVINKEIKRYEKHKSKMQASAIVVHNLMDRYNEIYGEKD